MSNTEIVIHGYYGAGNFGDDLILLSMLKSLLIRRPELKITVFSRNIYPIPGSSSCKVIPRFNKQEILEATGKADLVIAGGGGLLQDYSGFDLGDHFGERKKGINYYSLPLEIAYLQDTPTMLYAVGAGPFFRLNTCRYLKTLLPMINTVTVRDPSSAEVLQEIHPCSPEVTADPVVNLPLANNKEQFEPKKAGICLRNWFFAPDEKQKFISRIAAAADFLIENYGYRIILFPFNKSRTDRAVLEAVQKQIDNREQAELKLPEKPGAALEVIRELDFLLGMRLHSLITATTAGIPVFGLDYDRKIREYLQLLGQEKYCLKPREFRPDSFSELFQQQYQQRMQIKNEIKEKINHLRKREQKNTDLALSLLE